VPGGSSPRFSPSGHLVYGAENTIRAVPFDPARLEVLGDPIPLIEGVLMKGGGGGAGFSVAADSTLAYIAGGAGAVQRRLVWAERDGARRPINAPPHAYTSARISPDGTRVALDARDQQSDIQSPFNERNASGADEVYVRSFHDVESGRWQVSTAGGAHPAWAPNGRELFYVAADGRLMAVDVQSRAGFAASVPRMLVDVASCSTSPPHRTAPTIFRRTGRGFSSLTQGSRRCHRRPARSGRKVMRQWRGTVYPGRSGSGSGARRRTDCSNW